MDPAALATVNGASITQEQLDHLKLTLDQAIEREAMVQKAREQGLHEEPEIKEQIRSLLIARLKEKELHSKIEADEATLRKLYEEQKEKYVSPARKKIAVLWYNSRGQKPLEKQYQTRLTKILPEIENVPLNQGFGQFSMNHSEHRSSRFKGGIVGWLEPGKTYDSFRATALEIASQLEPGQVSEIVTRKEGVFLVRNLQESDPTTQSFEKVRAQLERDYRNTERRKREEEFTKDALSGAKINRKS